MGVGTQITPKKRPADGEPTLWAVVSLTEEKANLKTVGIIKNHTTQVVAVGDVLSKSRVSKDKAPVEVVSPSACASSSAWILSIFKNPVSA